MPALVESHPHPDDPGLILYEVSGRDRNDVLLEIERITGTAGDHVAAFEAPCRGLSMHDPMKLWRTRGFVRSLEHA